ncbi:ribonuclease H-like domain-containing protein [Tanacetum coccineum]
MCMFALTVSIVERKNKEAMADSAWIEVMQEELHQFDMTTSLGIVDKPLHEHNQLYSEKACHELWELVIQKDAEVHLEATVLKIQYQHRLGFTKADETNSTSSYSLLASQSSCRQLDHEDLGQGDEYDLEMTVDGECVDWTTHSKDDDNYAFMANNSSGSNTQREELSDASVEIKAYTQGLKKSRSTISCPSTRSTLDNPHRTLKNKGIIDSGCSRHMTGNKAYLADFQDFNGGPVAFGGSKGYITGKGKIKTGKLDFEDVSFVKELQHFNLFSVSQMCDKKNKVLFTDSECLVLSPDFKLPDENQILLKVPRQNNMYSFNLENIVPLGGLACLIAKATTDESNKWHRRLGHVNFKNLNRLVKGNLVRGLPTKLFQNDHTCVACQKGKQHKASCKFAGKSDEGFLVGYSLQSKAFRVYNLETKRVEENLHINFLENKPNVAGKGPNWLFDLDYLTDSMNYHSVRSENQANLHAEADFTSMENCYECFSPIHTSKNKSLSSFNTYSRRFQHQQFKQEAKVNKSSDAYACCVVDRHVEGSMSCLTTKDLQMRTIGAVCASLTDKSVVSTANSLESFGVCLSPKPIKHIRHITTIVVASLWSISEASIRTDLIFDDAEG